MDGMKFTSQRPPEWPPESVWREVEDAAQVWEELHAQGREIHFEIDDQSGRLTIEMRDLDGGAVGTLSPFEALSIASGAPAR
jgi:flagellar protein FlaG